MKPKRRLSALLALPAMLLAMAEADHPPQELRLDIAPGPQGTFGVKWNDKVPTRTYFLQYSLDLANWYYAPCIDFGDGEHSRGLESDAIRFFVRLDYGEFPEITSLDAATAADFDGDGLINIFEVTAGYNPFETNSTVDGPDASLDPDEDGLGNNSEQVAGGDPMKKDNVLLNLEVTED